MSSQLIREPVFTGLTRPQMFAGVTYTFFIINTLLTMELFLITKSFSSLLVAIVFHAIGAVACMREPRIFDLWIHRARRCQRLPSFSSWQCNSYRP